MTKMGAYAILARAALYYGSVDSSLLPAAGSAAKWVLDNWGAKAAVQPAGFKATYYTDNAVNSIFELAMSGTDNAGINGMAYIIQRNILWRCQNINW